MAFRPCSKLNCLNRHLKFVILQRRRYPKYSFTLHRLVAPQLQELKYYIIQHLIITNVFSACAEDIAKPIFINPPANFYQSGCCQLNA